MKFVPSKPVLYVLLAIALLLGFWGYCFELAYFGRLGLIAHKVLTVRHFIVSGGSTIIPMLIVLAMFTNVKRFFTKSIHTDPGPQFLEVIKSSSFDKQIWNARYGTAMSLTFLVLVIGLPTVGITIRLWPMYPYMVFIVLQSYFVAVLTSPPHALGPVIIMFAISVGACFAGGGYGYALSGQGKVAQVVRDDMVVTVSIGADGTLSAEPKPIAIPIPPSLKSLEKFSGG